MAAPMRASAGADIVASKPDKPKLPPVPSEAEIAARAASSTAERPVVGRPFPKGVSGNPSGRPKKIVEVIAQLEEALPGAATELIKLLKCPNAKVRLAAAREIFDRTVGRPKQTVEMTGSEDPMQLLRDAIDALAKPKPKPEPDDA